MSKSNRMIITNVGKDNWYNVIGNKVKSINKIVVKNGKNM